MLGKSVRYRIAGAGLVVATAVLGTMTAAASASVPRSGVAPRTFTGAITCTVKGRLLSSPPLTMSSTKTVLTLNATLSGCSGATTQNHVTIEKGTLSASATLTASCMSLQTAKGLSPSGTIRWATKGGSATPTKLSFSSASSSVSTGNGAITVSLPGTGKAVTSGSFAGSSSKATVVFDQTWSALAGQCLFPVGGGVSEIDFSGKLGPSAAAIG